MSDTQSICRPLNLDEKTRKHIHNFVVINKPFSLPTQQRQALGLDMFKIRSDYILTNQTGYEILDNVHYFTEETLTRFYLDFDFNKEEDIPDGYCDFIETIYKPLKIIFKDDVQLSISGYTNNLNFYNEINTNRKKYNNIGLCVEYKPGIEKYASFHVIIFNKFMKWTTFLNISNSIKYLFKNLKINIDETVYKKKIDSDKIFRCGIFNKQAKPEDPIKETAFKYWKYSPKHFKTIVLNCCICYVKEFPELEEFTYNETIEKPIQQPIQQDNTTQQIIIKTQDKPTQQQTNNTTQQNTDEHLKKIVKDRDTKTFNEEYSIFEFLGVKGSLPMKQLLYSLSDNDELPILEKSFLKELKIWFDKTEHTTYKTFESFLNFLNVKPNLNSLEVDKMYIKLISLSKKNIFEELLPALELIKIVKFLQNKIRKEKNPTKEEKKRLILKYNNFMDKTKIQAEKIEFDEITTSEFINKIYEIINSEEAQNILKPLSLKRGIFDLYENKLNTIKEKFLKSRFIHFSESSGLPQLQIAYIEDISKFYFKDKTIAEDTLKRKKIDTNQDFPMFESVLTLQQERYKYKGKTSPNKLDVEKWMNIFKDSFDSPDMFRWYMSWFHHKFNNKLINKNILNIGDKNCLKTSFIEYFSLIFDIRKATAKQVIGQFNGTIIEGKIVFIDEIQDLTEKDKTDFIQFVKNNTSTEIVSGEKKFENVETNKEKTFDMIMNTNIWSLPNDLFSSLETDKMLKRIKIIKRKELPIEILKDTNKFPDISKDIGFKYQLYKFIKHWDFKDIEPISEQDMRMDEEPTEFEKMYKDINTQEQPKLDTETFINEIKNNKIIKQEKGTDRYIFTFTEFKKYFETNKTEQIDIDIRTKKGKENLMVYLNKFGIKFDKKSRFDSKDDLNNFIKHFTEFETFDKMKEYIKKQEEENKTLLEE